jgi:hypothetical protein
MRVSRLIGVSLIVLGCSTGDPEATFNITGPTGEGRQNLTFVGKTTGGGDGSTTKVKVDNSDQPPSVVVAPPESEVITP